MEAQATLAPKWRHKDAWKAEGAGFLVEVTRHEQPGQEVGYCYDSEGPHRWCLYAYIYPSHPHFAKFTEGEDMSQDAADLGFHGGCTYMRTWRDSTGKVTSFQVGGDYHHDGDWRYTQMATKEDAYSVFNDAAELFEKLDDMKDQS